MEPIFLVFKWLCQVEIDRTHPYSLNVNKYDVSESLIYIKEFNFDALSFILIFNYVLLY